MNGIDKETGRQDCQGMNGIDKEAGKRDCQGVELDQYRAWETRLSREATVFTYLNLLYLTFIFCRSK